MANPYDDGPEFSIGDLMDTLRRRKWVIIQAFIFVTVIGIVTAVLSPPIYQTQAKLLVETPGMAVVSAVDTSNALSPLMQMRQKQSLATQLAILRSVEFYRRVHDNLSFDLQAAAIGMSYGTEEGTSIIQVIAEGTDPVAATGWANAAASEYVRLTEQSNREAIRETRRYLELEAGRSRRELAIAEHRLLDFRRKTNVADNEHERSVQRQEAAALAAKARDTANELTTLQSKIVRLKNKLATAPEMVNETVVLPNPEVVAVREQIAKLKAERAILLGRYTPESARIIDINEEIASLQMVKAELPLTIREKREKPNEAREQMHAQKEDMELQREALTKLYGDLRAAADQKVSHVDNFAAWQVQLMMIQRERDLAEKTYLDYSEKLRDLNVREKTIAATATVMEQANVPSTSVRPNKVQQVALAMVMGLMLGVGFAFLQEFLDDRVNSPDDIERLTALPTLGTVPSIGDERNRLLIGHDALSPLTESYRALRTGVQYSSVDRPVHTLIVTSAHPGEGKSVTSANLAIAVTLQGKRVILIDADLRRPSVHRMFQAEAEPGLTSVLAGEVPLDEALRSTVIDGFSILTAGPLPPNPPELLNSQAMLDLLEQLRQRADLVIIDTPPVIPVTDTQALASHVDGVVLVVEAGKARKVSVRAARELLEQTRARILGVVLNKIDRRSKGYYHRYYGPGYPESTYGRTRSGYTTLGLENGPAGPAGAAEEGKKAQGQLPERLRDWE
jgi:polysaccharide biosynthesis transport protein